MVMKTKQKIIKAVTSKCLVISCRSKSLEERCQQLWTWWTEIPMESTIISRLGNISLIIKKKYLMIFNEEMHINYNISFPNYLCYTFQNGNF